MITREVTLWGEKMTLSSNQDTDFIDTVAAYMDTTLANVQASDPMLITTSKAWKQACFLIAAELLLARRELSNIDEKVKKIESIIAFA